MKKILLIILSGFGEGRNDYTNPIYLAKKNFLNFVRDHYPLFLLQASGIVVGLPWKEAGNSETGHLAIGTGRVYYKNYPRITLSIKDGSFFENLVLKSLLEHAKENKSRIHLIGLLSKSINHSALEHLVALLVFFKKNNFKEVFLHLFLDGKDSPPKSGLELLKNLEKEIEKIGVGIIATLCGRNYGMDENREWKIKTQVAFLLISQGIGKEITDYKNYLENIYDKEENFSDNNLEPLIINREGILRDNDAIFFFNFRESGMYQLAKAFLDPNFNEFKRVPKSNLFIASMTKYLKEIEYPVAFQPLEIKNCLSKVIAEAGLKQLKIVEQNKAENLIFYFNGYKKEPYPGEFWKIIPSYEGDYKENPLLQSEVITDLIIEAVKEGIYHLIISEYSAPDIIGHTGDLKLGIKLVEALDAILYKIYKFLENKNDWYLIITSDHGNLELMINPYTGDINPEHTTNPVPCFIINKEVYIENKTKYYIIEEKKIRGTLIDIPVTILNLMKIPKPDDFEGTNLLAKI